MSKAGHASRNKVIGMVFIAALALVAGVAFNWFMQKDFSDSEGNNYRWRDFSGEWVVVNYFAEWCAPCLKEIPELNQFAATAPANVSLFAINYDPLASGEVAALKARYDIQFPVIVSSGSKMPMGAPPYLPATYIINPHGEIAKVLHGEQTADGLNTLLKQLTSQPL